MTIKADYWEELQIMKREENKKKPFYKKWWFWLIIAFAIIIVGNTLSDSGNKTTPESTKTEKTTPKANTKETKEAEKKVKNFFKSDDSKKEDNVPAEYKSALNKAKTYSNLMYMSKKGIYDQLTSEYGDKFSAEAAQYAVDNLKADYNKNALKKAKSYQKDQNMSSEGIRDQLTSEYGEKFTQSEADYAVQHLND